MPFLVWDSPQGRSVRELDRKLIVIGRDKGSDLVLDDPTVSRRHALVQVEGAVKITDLRSTTGTKINGARLAPDVPCTLEPGDFLQVGKIVLSFHTAAPPAAPPPAPPPPLRPPRTKRPLPWKPVLLTLAFVTVTVGGALLALRGRKEAPPEPAETRPVAVEPAPAKAGPANPAAKEKPAEPAPAQATERPPPKEEPKPPPPGPERAAAGELPPRGLAPDLPDLIEVDGKTHLAGRVEALGDARIEVVGADGRIYSIPAARVTKIEDRGDLARRIAAERRRLAPDDVAARVALAGWCIDRLMREEARGLVREALSLKPQDAGARAAQARLEEFE